MAYIGNNPKLKSIVSSGDTLANLTAEPRKAGRLVYATDEQKFFVDNGVALSEVGAGGFNAIDTKANLDALARVQGKIYYATDEDKVYTDDGTQLVQLGGSGGIATLQKGALLTSNGTQNGELEVGTDGNFLKANSAQDAGLEWVAIQEVPETGTTGHYLQKTGAGPNDYAFAAIPAGGVAASNMVHQSMLSFPSRASYAVVHSSSIDAKAGDLIYVEYMGLWGSGTIDFILTVGGGAYAPQNVVSSPFSFAVAYLYTAPSTGSYSITLQYRDVNASNYINFKALTISKS